MQVVQVHKESLVLDTARLFFDATVGLAIMATLAIISALAAAALTDDRSIVILVGGCVFTLTGAFLMIRLWRMTPKPVAPAEPGA